MANSMYRLTAENSVERLPSPVIFHEPSGLYYQVFEQDGRFFQKEFRRDSQGEQIHELTREMVWVVGSGTAARTYLTVVNDHYLELPLTWYTGGEGRWDFSPGYKEKNSRFDRAIPDRCMVCHNGYPETVPFVNGRYESIPSGIGCERCHGPGSVHVEARLENPEPASDIDPTIVNPAHLPIDLRLDVCQQCHLNGTVSILRRGRDAYAFRPSEPLDAHIALFSFEEAQTGQIEVISHAKRMKMSECFVQTQSRPDEMDCTTCHDPHQGFRKLGPEYFNDRCIACHPTQVLQETVSASSTENHQPDSDCFSCHMPKVEAIDAPHASFTDHWVRVVERSQPASVEPSHAGPRNLESYFNGDQETPYEGIALVVLGTQRSDTTILRRGAEQLKASIALDPDFGEAHYQLGQALFALGHLQDAKKPIEESVRLGPDIPERLNALAQLYERLLVSPSRVEGLYRRALEIQPAQADIRINYGRFLETQDRATQATEHYRQAARDTPANEKAHYNLGTALLREGDLEGGEQHLREAIRLNPDYAQAYGNLAVMLATQGQTDEARALFERAVEAQPNDPVALNNLASFYLNIGDDARSVSLLRKAVVNRPDYVEAVANLSLALLRVGDDRGAQEYALKAIELDPSNGLANQVLRATR
jgi:Tfp pilus assembly protein PilF